MVRSETEIRLMFWLALRGEYFASISSMDEITHRVPKLYTFPMQILSVLAALCQPGEHQARQIMYLPVGSSYNTLPVLERALCDTSVRC